MKRQQISFSIMRHRFLQVHILSIEACNLSLGKKNRTKTSLCLIFRSFSLSECVLMANKQEYGTVGTDVESANLHSLIRLSDLNIHSQWTLPNVQQDQSISVITTQSLQHNTLENLAYFVKLSIIFPPKGYILVCFFINSHIFFYQQNLPYIISGFFSAFRPSTLNASVPAR